ncbi:hypothetical protein V1264_000440 [Littorina saxatilis]|uniref:Uncharacterized protein n=2 Tax=Littorina saxatilis TaxID=31220 RepID=A0AAN9C4N3_9CAEN
MQCTMLPPLTQVSFLIFILIFTGHTANVASAENTTREKPPINSTNLSRRQTFNSSVSASRKKADSRDGRLPGQASDSGQEASLNDSSISTVPNFNSASGTDDNNPTSTFTNSTSSNHGEINFLENTLSSLDSSSRVESSSSDASRGKDNFEHQTRSDPVRNSRAIANFQENSPYNSTSDSDGGDTFVQKTLSDLSSTVFGDGRKMYQQLVKMLLEVSDPMVPPVISDGRTPVNITVDMIVESLVELDMTSQTFTLSVWFQVQWRDEALAWDRALRPVDVVVLGGKLVWRPVLVIYNTVLPRDQLMKGELPLNVDWQGNFEWYPGETLVLDCQVDLSLYPFDTQTCWVKMTQWGQIENMVNCTAATLRSSVSGNGEWDIIDTTVQRKVSDDAYVYWHIEFGITLKRKWVFYAINVLFPVVLVSNLNCLVFLLPVESGEKMSVSVTTFLTLAVFMTLVQDSLPSNSDTVCYLAVYLAIQMSFGALTVFLTAVQVAFHHKGAAVAERRRGCSKALKHDDVDLVSLSEETAELGPGRRQHDTTRSPSKASCKMTPEKHCCLDEPGRTTVCVSDHETMPEKHAHLPTKMDSICFPVFIALNMISFLVYILLVTV